MLAWEKECRWKREFGCLIDGICEECVCIAESRMRRGLKSERVRLYLYHGGILARWATKEGIVMIGMQDVLYREGTSCRLSFVQSL